MKNLSTTILVRCFNEEKYIGKLLSGISKQTVRPDEVIVVDSGSTDATLTIASRFKVKILHIKSEDFSFGRSLNIGCSEAKGDIIIFASAHVYPLYDDWVSKIIEPFKDSSIGIVYGKQRGNDLTKFSEHQVFKKWFPRNNTVSNESIFCNNANAAIRKSIWTKIPYNEILTGLEDIDWAKKINEKSFKIVYQNESTVIHVHEESFMQIQNRYRREAIAFKAIYPSANFSLSNFFWMSFSNIISDYYYSILKREFFNAFFSIPFFRFNQFWGTYTGYRQIGAVPAELKKIFYFPNGLNNDKNKLSKAKNNRLINYEDN